MPARQNSSAHNFSLPRHYSHPCPANTAILRASAYILLLTFSFALWKTLNAPKPSAVLPMVSAAFRYLFSVLCFSFSAVILLLGSSRGSTVNRGWGQLGGRVRPWECEWSLARAFAGDSGGVIRFRPHSLRRDNNDWRSRCRFCGSAALFSADLPAPSRELPA